MPKRMIFITDKEAGGFRMFDLRQGLAPLPVAQAANEVYVDNYSNALAITPDAGLLVQAVQNGEKTLLYSDPLNLGGRSSPAALFSGTAYATAASNAHYAFGGTGPFLYVFARSDGALQTVPTAGLGTVRGLAFSPDGSMLAVGHETVPRLRIYNTADWTHVDAQETAVGQGKCDVCFSHDGGQVLITSYAEPSLSVFDAQTGAGLYTSNAVIGPYSGAQSGCVRSPMDGKTLLFCFLETPFIGSFDMDAHTAQMFTAPSPVIGEACGLIVDPEPDEDAVYLLHLAGQSTRGITKFRISTGEMYAEQPDTLGCFLFASKARGESNANGTGGVIIETTPHRIHGTVRDINNAPAARVVRAYRRGDGQLMAQTTSDAVTGDYTIRVYDSGPYDLQFMTADGEMLNDLIYARTEPEPL